MSNKQWEYRVESVDEAMMNYPEQLQFLMNKFGREEWELASAIRHSYNDDGRDYTKTTFIFKKLK
jgi:hypothetical protein